MDRATLRELHFITPTANLESIVERGILSRERAAKLPHADVSMAAIQDRRHLKTVPDARLSRPRKLHTYANLYLTARNPMMCKRQDGHAELCVLRVDPRVLDLDDVVVSDGNASSDYTLFEGAPAGLRIVDEERTFARYWTDPNLYVYYEKKRRKCAEVLVPDVVDADYIVGAHVSGVDGRVTCPEFPFPVVENADIFFQ